MGSLGWDQNEGGRRQAGRVLPGVAVWAGAAALLAVYDTPWSAILAYSTYLSFGIMLPGVLLWRLLRGNQDGFAADLAFGTGLGFALSILTYLPGRAIGFPYLPVAVPLLTIAAFAALKNLRPYWRSDRPPLPLWWAWSVAAAAGLGLWVITRNGLQIEPMTFPDAAFQYSDMPYQLALAAELKHHVPGQIPFVIGESLNYHWFLHAEAAAANWLTGIELDVLLRRLIPMTAALVPILSVAALATRLARKSWAGPLAAWLLLTVTSLDVYGWGGRDQISQAAYSSGVLMYSLTHAFAVVLAFPVVWVIVCLLRKDPGRGNWVLLVVGLAALAGAKASFVPMLAAAVLLAAVVKLATERRVDRTSLGLGLAVLAALSFAQFVLFSAGASGVAFEPGQAFRIAAGRLGFGSRYSDHAAAVAVLGTTAATLLASWSLAGLGMLGFVRERKWKDPAAVFLVGFVLTGVAAAALLRHPGLSQLYFLRAAFPIAIAASVWGLSLLLSGLRLRQLVPRVLGALVAGMAVAEVIAAMTSRRPRNEQGIFAVSVQVLWPWVAVFLVAALVTVVLRRTKERTAALGLGVLLVLGAATVNVPQTMLTTFADQVCVGGPDRPECRQTRRQVPTGGAEAARYIRDHSAVRDRLATNSHCMPVYTARKCDARNFWLAGYAERRVLVEGWAYTPTAQSRKDSDAAVNGPFWDQPLLQLNDRAFKRPTKRVLDQLWTQYGVRWLVFDTNLDRPPAQLGSLAEHRFTAGAVAVYALTAPTDGPVGPGSASTQR
ncbi:hypothetical protein [Kribbella sp. ALI-6-A]|uniref:hypothetical protein n=1 Tax=Kribbella sp. ALI-6-A TaxID=1933817 RepID=UPI00117A0639|nr:hypothetical protein [Kribbella sp. ALI-6-A]